MSDSQLAPLGPRQLEPIPDGERGALDRLGPAGRLAEFEPSRDGIRVHGRSRRHRRQRGRVAWFLLAVLIPTALAAIYFLNFASDQYVSEFDCVIHAGDAGHVDAASLLQASVGASQFMIDSNVVVEYIKSRQIVDALDKKLNLRSIYSRSDIDLWSRMNPKSSIDDLVAYWDTMVDPFFDMTTGTIKVRVRAFSPNDARRIAIEIIGLTGRLVDDISLKARTDAVQADEEQVARAGEKLRKARAAVLQYRNSERLLNPEKEGDAKLALLAKLQDSLAEQETHMATLRATLAADAPPVRVLTSQIAALQQQINGLQSQLTASGPDHDDVLSTRINADEALETDQILATKNYDAALVALEQARAAADRQLTYLSVFVTPDLPQVPSYPKRLQSIAFTLLGGIGVWIMGIVLYHSVREHV